MTHRIMYVGEAMTREDAENGALFTGGAGNVLSMLLRTVGIRKEEVYFTNVFNCRAHTSSNDLIHFCGPKAEGIPGLPAYQSGKYIRAEFAGELDRLFNEIERENPNVIIAAGAAATLVLLGTSGVRKIRGAPIGTAGIGFDRVGFRKLVPTYPASSVIRDWSLRPIVMADLAKAARESEYPEIRRPEREFWLAPTVEDLEEFERRFITPGCDLSMDIETAAGQITCIGFAPSPSVAIVIPFTDAMQKDGNYWRTLNEERAAWKFVRRLCETHPLLGQNIIYDMNYLWRVYGIRCFNMKDDTMLMHHSLQPEMEKGLGFLGSIYTDEPSWKFMRAKHETLKKED